MKINLIKSNPNNPRLIKDDKFKKLVQSIKEFPKMMALRPMVINKDNVILGGNMRFKALKELNYKEVPEEWIKRAEDLTDDETRRFIIADNVGFGAHDWDMLANEWDSVQLAEWGLDVWQNEDDLEEPDFNELTDDSKKDAVIKITFKNEEHLEDAEEEIAKLVSKYEKAFYSVSSEK